jgi:hypothetical protein
MKYKGTTVNERLYISGLMDEYEKAVREKNINKVKSILKEVELTDNAIKAILEKEGLISSSTH